MLAHREAGKRSDRVVLLVHGYPESSYMWRHVMPALADAGWWAVAPDLAGFGDSEPNRPGTWEHHMELLDDFVRELDIAPAVLVVHDWGAPIGLRWACDNPERVLAFVISDGGFFSDRRWHDVANVLRTPGEGEKLIRAFTRDALGGTLKAGSTGMTDDALDEYWKAFDGEDRRMAHLELYRSGDFEKLEPYDQRLAELALPTLIVWGEQDAFATVNMAHRFHDEIPGSELVVFEDAGHFVWEDEPEKASASLLDFLARRATSA